MSSPQPLMQGKKGLVMGVANDRSIAWGIASALSAQGAELAFTYQGDALGKRVKPLAASVDSDMVIPCDVTDNASMDALFAEISERWGKLDILVGNAAILGSLTPMGHIKPTDWDQIMAVNVTANWRLIRSLDPLLRASDAGRAMFVTSGVAKGGFAYWGGYAISKAALECMVTTYAAELGKTNAQANIIEPGIVRTAMRAAAMPGEDPSTLPDPASITDVFVDLADPACTRNGERLVVEMPS